MQLAQELCDLPSDRLVLMGEGVDTEYESDGDRFRHKYGIHGPFLLYAGRKDRGKNLTLLVQYFQRFRRASRSPIELVLIGGGESPHERHPGGAMRDLGFLPVQDKWDAYAAASVLCQPSTRESFSLVMMEAWVARTPVLVHADCAVTADFCRQSNAGLCFASYPEFALALELLVNRPQLALAMGHNGRQFVLLNFAWEHIIDRYAELLDHETGKA
jgi:glycosyltransferase involved in cell wall biosynthesis